MIYSLSLERAVLTAGPGTGTSSVVLQWFNGRATLRELRRLGQASKVNLARTVLIGFLAFAVVGTIAASAAFEFSKRGIGVIDPVPGGLPSITLP